jgi:hypothetical protein
MRDAQISLADGRTLAYTDIGEQEWPCAVRCERSAPVVEWCTRSWRWHPRSHSGARERLRTSAVDFLSASQRRDVFTKVLQTVDKKFTGSNPDTKRLREEHEPQILQCRVARAARRRQDALGGRPRPESD